MGRDISPFGNHKLNTESIKELAKDIVSRIDINVEYGYFGRKEHFKLLGNESEDELVIIDKIVKHKDFKTFRLIDESYQLKELHNKIVSEKEVEDFYEGAIYGFSYEMGRDLVLINDIELNGYNGKLFDLITTGYEGHILGSNFLINNVVYMSTAISDQEEKVNLLKDFVKSFKLKD